MEPLFIETNKGKGRESTNTSLSSEWKKTNHGCHDKIYCNPSSRKQTTSREEGTAPTSPSLEDGRKLITVLMTKSCNPPSWKQTTSREEGRALTPLSL